MLDEQYIKLIGQRCGLFKATGNHKYTCRCMLCGDSKSNKKKASGSFYIWKGTWLYHCYKCGKSYNIPTLLEMSYPDLYDDYIMGKHKERTTTQKTIIDTTQKAMIDTTQKPKRKILETFNLQKLLDLPDDHPAVSYVRDRKLPTKYWSDLYYAPEFKKWSNTIVKGAFASDKYDDARIVIPFRDKDGIFAFQGRALGPSKVKYLTVKIDQNKRKIFGLERIDKSKPIYIVEGPFDSLFLDNALGTADSNLGSLEGIYIWDNEPRSPIICKKMEDAIDKGKPIVIWKKSHLFNDINDAIQNFGFTIAGINEIVRKRTFQGLEALAELNNWRKS